MPPHGRPRPDVATYSAIAAAIESKLDAAAEANPNPGRVAVHRLNRAEYTAAIRDLLALEVDGKALLSADEADQEGFDNVASVLSVSPLLLENYRRPERSAAPSAIPHSIRPSIRSRSRNPWSGRADERQPAIRTWVARSSAPLPARQVPSRFLRRGDGDIIGMGSRINYFRWTARPRTLVGGEAGMTTPETRAIPREIRNGKSTCTPPTPDSKSACP
jgi:hypothetical protein